MQAERVEPRFGAQIIDRLIDPQTRLEALREIEIAKQREDPIYDWKELPMAAFELYHRDVRVTECPQLNGASSLYLVTFRSDRDSFSRYYSRHESMRSSGFAPVEDSNKPAMLSRDSDGRTGNWSISEANPHLSLPPESKLEDCVLIFLTAQGQLIWPFQGANIGEGDVIKDLNGDGRYERLYSSNFMVYDRKKGEPDVRVQALRVEAVEPESERLFYILLNWHTSDSELCANWGWAVRDLEGDGLDEIVIGPIADKEAEPEAEVVYHWDAKQQQYVGPEGSFDEHYLLLDSKAKLWDELRRVKAAGGLQYEAAARASAPKSKEAVSDEPPYDWRRREAYRHRSLSGASKADLLDFMCAWSPVPPSYSENAKADSATTNHRFEFKTEAWSGLSPKEAAFAYVDSNQSHVHRNKYTLYLPTNLTEAARAEWVVLGSLMRPGVEVIRTSDTEAGQYLSGKYTRSLPEKYPSGDFRWEWTLGQVDPERAQWFQEMLWWLAQLRSEPKESVRGYHMSRGFSTNCFPSHMESPAPAVRLLGEGPAALIDIQGERASAYTSSWREEYGPEQYLGFVRRLWEDSRGMLFTKKTRTVTIDEVFESMPNLVEDLPEGRIPPELAQAMIRSAGDSGHVARLAQLRTVEAQLPELRKFELEHARLKKEIEALPQQFDVETYKLKLQLESQLAAVMELMRDDVWSWLRQPLRFAIKQLEAAEDPDALSTWAGNPGEPGALWALVRLKEIDADRWHSVLSQVCQEQSEWRNAVVRYFAYQDPEVAQGMVKQLPRAAQLEVSASLARATPASEMSPEMVGDLLDTIRSENLEAAARIKALRQLTPRSDPLGASSIEVDQVLLEVFRREMERRQQEDWAERSLVTEIALVLLLRDQVSLPVGLYLKGADMGWNPFSFGSYLDMVVHWAMIKDSAEARDWLVQWGQDFIEKDAGSWSRFAEIVYTADLREFRPFLERLATLEPGDLEGGSALGKGRQPELMHGERYHLARQIVAAWSEPDALTRAKCNFLLGLSSRFRFSPESLQSRLSQAQNELVEIYQQLSPAQRAELMAFVQWCRDSINPAQMDSRSLNFLNQSLDDLIQSKVL